jgi:PTS system ascorbate-specific IIA component
MTGLLLLAHAPLASSLREVAAHAFPEAECLLQAVDVGPDMSPEAVEQAGQEALRRLAPNDVLILTDVFGATPSNVAQRLADGQRVKVVTGVNVPMLWRALCYAGEPLDAVVGRAIAGATQGVMQVAVVRPQNQAQKPSIHDPSNHQHQQ